MITLAVRPSPLKPTPVFDTYWKFAAERQAIFFKRAAGLPAPWTEDPILARHKFTNAYRASDRVSQYLIRKVIYTECQDVEESFFRTILFKLFNRIETWETLVAAFGEVSWRKFDKKAYSRILSAEMGRGRKVYSAAYIMPSGGRASLGGRKHDWHLSLLQRMMEEGYPEKVSACRSMGEAFDLLRDLPSIGDFLAYQLVTDLNYGPVTSFSERSFVVPGPGARDGLKKCFYDLGGLSEAEAIAWVADRQETEFARLGLDFKSLWGRPLQYIDCQNLFCEVDKYARVAHPEFAGRSGRTRIKQAFHPKAEKIDYRFPPKWGINDAVAGGPARLVRTAETERVG